jgi:hypothetical protein
MDVDLLAVCAGLFLDVLTVGMIIKMIKNKWIDRRR